MIINTCRNQTLNEKFVTPGLQTQQTISAQEIITTSGQNPRTLHPVENTNKYFTLCTPPVCNRMPANAIVSYRSFVGFGLHTLTCLSILNVEMVNVNTPRDK